MEAEVYAKASWLGGWVAGWFVKVQGEDYQHNEELGNKKTYTHILDKWY